MSLWRAPLPARRATAAAVVAGLVAALSTTAPGTISAAIGVEPATNEVRLGKVDPELRAEMRSTDSRLEALVVLRADADLSGTPSQPRRVSAALERTARTSQASVVDAIESRGDHVVNSFWLENMLLARLTPETLGALTAMDAVEEIVPNFEVSVGPAPVTDADAPREAATWGLERIGADVVQEEYGLTGEGVRVAVLDTGVDAAHPDLAGKLVTDDPSDPSHPGGWLEFSRTGEPVASTPHDSDYHGTHVSGTLVGGDGSGTRIGVAPGADLMAGLVLPGGNGTFAQVVAGMQWAVAPYDAEGNPAGEPADVVNMSLGVTGRFSALVEPTRNMYLAGVFPSFSIGNNCGGGSEGPGNVYEATAVGATDQSDDVADFSCGEVVHTSDWSDPPAEWPESYVVPDVSAPGVGVYSALPGGEYGELDGTSMATPHVSGTVALMLQARPDLGVDEALQTLIDTSFFDDRYGSVRPNPRYGWGRIDAHRAVSRVAFDSGIRGAVTDAETGEPIPNAHVTRTQVGRGVVTDDDGRYRMHAPPGTHDLTISAFGYETATVDAVDVTAGEFTVVDHRMTPVPTGRLTGTVTYGPTGSRVPGASVRVLGVEADLASTTALNGRFTIDRVPDGDYRVVAKAPGIPRSEVAEVRVVAGSTTKGVDLRLPRPWAIDRLSEPVPDTGSSGDSLVPTVSADGRYVAFYSFASDLVEGDTNGQADVFVRDRRTGETERISVGPDGLEGDRASVRPSISADGRFVTYSSFATNLVTGDSNGASDIFVHDRQTGVTERVSVGSGGAQSNGSAFAPAISGNGRFVSFYSSASSLVEGDTNGQSDVFVHDRQTGETERVSVRSDGVQANGGSFVSSLSTDGEVVVFETLASNLVDDDTNGAGDVFVHDRSTGTTERVSLAADGSEGNGSSQGASLSADGRYVAFYSRASNLVAGDTNGVDDVFVRDRDTGTTERVSVSGDGSEGNAGSQGIPMVSLSGDGRLVTFASTASNLVAGDTNGRADVFVRDRDEGSTLLASVAPDGMQGDRPSQGASISADGRTLTFHSEATVLATDDVNRSSDVFAVDLENSEPRAVFVLADLQVRPARVRPGRPATVRVMVKNVGDLAGTHDVALYVDGQLEDQVAVTASPDRWSWATFTVRRSTPGTYPVTIGSLTGELVVR